MLPHPSSRIHPPRLRSLVCVSAALLLPSACASSEEVGSVPRAQQLVTSVGVIRVTASGNGCPRGSWGAGVSDDRSRVTLRFERLAASSNAGADKRCDVRIALSGADGYAYAPSYLTSRGDVDGASGTNGEASLSTLIAWEGDPSTGKSVTVTADGPFEETEEVVEEWSVCRGTRELRVRPRLAVRSGRAAVYEQELGLVTKRCADQSSVDASTPAPDASTNHSADAPRSPQLSKSGNCPNTSVVATAEGISVLLPAHSLELPAAMPAAQKACYLQFDQVVRDGKTSAIHTYVVEGTATLAEGTTATVRVIPYVFGAGWASGADGGVLQGVIALEGPHTGAFRSEVSIAEADLQFAPCSEGAAARLSLDVLTDISSTGAPGGGGSLSIAKVSALRFKEKACVP